MTSIGARGRRDITHPSSEPDSGVDGGLPWRAAAETAEVTAHLVLVCGVG
jgi:hypothetical protein